MFKKYSVVRVSVESKTIKSFYLVPEDNTQIPDYIAGQFVNIKVKMPDIEKELIRSYTISDSPNNPYIRITIKKEPKGKVSSYLHELLEVGDSVMLSKPMGNFHLSNQNINPVVLISGGVGITPMLSIAEYINAYQPNRKVYFIHSSINKEVRPMVKRLNTLNSENDNFILSIHHTTPSDDEIVDIDYNFSGYITKEYLINHMPAEELEIYLCGPSAFMETMYLYLLGLGIKSQNIFYEYFGGGKKLETLIKTKNSNNEL